MELRKELTDILIKAAEKPGVGYDYNGKLFEEEYDEIEKRGFVIHLRRPWMGGGGEYSIKYPYRRTNV